MAALRFEECVCHTTTYDDVGSHVEQVFALEIDRPVRDLIFFSSRQDGSQCTFTGTVWSHDRVHFACFHFEVQTFQDLFAFDGGM